MAMNDNGNKNMQCNTPSTDAEYQKGLCNEKSDDLVLDHQQQSLQLNEDLSYSHAGIVSQSDGIDVHPSSSIMQIISETSLSDGYTLPQQIGNEVHPNELARRRSTRDIKRPKFDDEIVESINMIQPKFTPKRRQSHEKSVSANNSYEEDQPRQGGSARKKGGSITNPMEDGNFVATPTSTEDNSTQIPPLKQSRKRKLASVDGDILNKANKMKKLQHNQADEFDEKADASNNGFKINHFSYAETMKIWMPEDDIALIAAVTHVSDLWVVYSQMAFSRRYTLEQIEDRWYELLYNEQASQLARKRMEQISKDRIYAVQIRIPFSMKEEQLISEIPSNVSKPTSQIEKMLEQYRDVFHHARTIKRLEEHWRELKSMYLLADQQPQQNLFSEDDYIEQTNDVYSLVGLDPYHEQLPLDVEERQFTRNVNINERETHEWENVLVSAITGITPSNSAMATETIGMLCGRCTTFDIRKEKVLIGRSTKRHTVDVDLTLEGPTARISRKQAILKMTECGDCLLRNIGKTHIVINERILMEGEAAKMSNNTIIEISMIKLKFLKNENYRRAAEGINHQYGQDKIAQ